VQPSRPAQAVTRSADAARTGSPAACRAGPPDSHEEQVRPRAAGPWPACQGRPALNATVLGHARLFVEVRPRSPSRALLCVISKGSVMLDSTQSSDGVVIKPSSKSVPQTIGGLRRLMADRGFTVFNVIDLSGVAERAGVQMPDSKLVMVGKPAVGRGGDARGAACCAGHPTQGTGVGGQERSGISELQFTGVSGQAAPPRACTARALRRS
jgi:hypothetical protein